MTDRKNHLANLKAIRSNVDLAIEQVEKEILEKEGPALAQGQLWKNGSLHYIVTHLKDGSDDFILVNLESGNTWADRKGFNGWKSNFTYVGTSNLIRVEGK